MRYETEMLEQEQPQKFMVRYYETYSASGGGSWYNKTFIDNERAVGFYLEKLKAQEHRGPQFYVLENIPIKISFSSVFKKIFFKIKLPKNIDVVIK